MGSISVLPPSFSRSMSGIRRAMAAAAFGLPLRDSEKSRRSKPEVWRPKLPRPLKLEPFVTSETANASATTSKPVSSPSSIIAQATAFRWSLPTSAASNASRRSGSVSDGNATM